MAAAAARGVGPLAARPTESGFAGPPAGAGGRAHVVNRPLGDPPGHCHGFAGRVTVPRPDTSVTVAEWNATGPAYRASPRAVGSGACTYRGSRRRARSPR